MKSFLTLIEVEASGANEANEAKIACTIYV